MTSDQHQTEILKTNKLLKKMALISLRVGLVLLLVGVGLAVFRFQGGEWMYFIPPGMGLIAVAIFAFNLASSLPNNPNTGINFFKEIIKVRCQNCKALNDENNKFCGQCGKSI